jgi:hypothetical protein
MANYFIEVQTPTHSGFHNHGSGRTGDPFHIVGKQYALAMNLEFAKRRAEMYRKSRNRARIVDAEGRVVIDWHEPLVAQETTVTLHNAHETSVWRDKLNGQSIEIPLVYNRATRTFYFKFTTSPNPGDPPDISVAGTTPAEVFSRFVSNPFWQQFIARYAVEDFDPAATAAQTAPTALRIELKPDQECIGIRPGSIRY